MSALKHTMIYTNELVNLVRHRDGKKILFNLEKVPYHWPRFRTLSCNNGKKVTTKNILKQHQTKVICVDLFNNSHYINIFFFSTFFDSTFESFKRWIAIFRPIDRKHNKLTIIIKMKLHNNDYILDSIIQRRNNKVF